MKHTRCYILLMLLTLMGLSMEAQTANTISVPDITAQIGEAQLPVVLENSSDIVALQFDLKLPEGMTADETATLSNRCDDHVVTVRYISGDTYRVVLVSPTNRPVRGQSGVLLYIPIYISPTFDEGGEYTVAVNGAVLSDAAGDNVVTGMQAGTISITKLPDLTVKSIVLDKQTITPGDTVRASWVVENVGGLATGGGWTEQLSLVSEDGSVSKLVATTYYDQTLEAGATVNRQAEVVIPALLGIDGDARLQVRLVPGEKTGESQSAQGNNTGSSEASYIIKKVLTLQLQPSRVEENSSKRITARLSRSGRWDLGQVFNLHTTTDSRLSVPATVTIPASQSARVFYLTLTDNDVLDTDSIINIAVEGNGYDKIEQQLVIIDNEYPDLQVTASKSSLNEGETFQLTITTTHVSADPIVVTLSCENPRRFTFPSQVTIPAGESSVTVDVTAINDDIPSIQLSTAFTASATNYNKGEVVVVLNDDDLPLLELSLTPSTVQENAGPVSVIGVLRRTTNTDSKITVKISDDSNGGLYFGNQTLELAKGVEEVHFNFGPVDNMQVDGDRTYTITAAVYMSTCDCSVVGDAAGAVSTQLIVLDNDGPALSVTASATTVKEGDTTTLTITRNTATDAAISVQLSSDYDDQLTYDHMVTIPAGESLVNIDVVSKTNDITNDNHIVVFTAQTDGYSSGTCWVMITDQTLPDMTVKSIAITPDNIMVGDCYTVDVTIANNGVADIPARSTFVISIAGETLAMTIADAIAPMQEKVVTLNMTAPAIPGDYTVSVECNRDFAFAELQTYNNSLSVPLAVASAFDFSVTTDRTVYQIGETVKISGHVSAIKGNAANVNVEPYIICYGMRQVLSATTDANGNFTAEYTLPVGMGGDFTVGACVPGEEAVEAQATIHVYGMARTSAAYLKGYVTVGKTENISVPIKNLSSLPLHNIKTTVTDNAGHYDVTAPVLAELDGNGEATIELALRSDVASTTRSWEVVHVTLSSDEGTTMDFVIHCFANVEEGRLEIDRTNINANIGNTKPTVIPVTLTNTGQGATGRITVMVPGGQQFFSLTTPAEISSLEQGDSVVVGLCFNPEGLDVNVIQRGSIAINCENADGKLINYNLKVVGEQNGNLKVLVEDENTIYGNAAGEHPYVSGATVALKDYSTGNVLYSAVTQDEGSVLFSDVPEGYYTLYVTASKHSSYMQNVLVSPGQTNEHLATISYQPISISWNVVETTTEDQYEIVTEVDYETQVPVPVMEMIAPDTLDLYSVEEGQPLLYHIVVTNKGLIAAQNVCIGLPEAEGFKFTPLDTYAGFELAPQQSQTIPVLVTRDDSPSASRRMADDNIKYICGKDTYLNWQWVCKNHRDAWWVKTVYFLMRNCKPTGVKPMPPANVEEDWPTRDVGPEPKLRYYNIEPVDLETIKEIVSTVACMMVCALPEKLTTEWVKEPKFRWRCAFEEAANRHPYPASSRQMANSSSPSLRDSYLDRLYLFINLSESVYNFYEMLANAPQLSDDSETFNLLMPSMDEILLLMGQLHNEGTLYTISIDDLCGMSVSLLPQQTADWYDFNLRTFIERQLNTFRLRDGQTVSSDNYCDVAKLDAAADSMALWQSRIRDLGYVDYKDMIESMNADAEVINSKQSNVCAKVKMQLSQEMVFTRQAFLGTLVIENSTDNELTDISALITATDENGTVATSREMEIILESAEGFVKADDGSYKLGAGQTGSFAYKFIPTKYAAPNHVVDYDFGGVLTFNDGSGITKRDLYPVTLTVKPSPVLDLTYFMQRDIYGDDPLTLDVVEPTVPAEFALLINNVGNGDATNVRMTTQQPEIIDNEKGLNINFEFLSSQVNGQPASLAFGQSIANDFGTIAAHEQAYGQWWLQSSLLGHFINYNVTATHVTSYGNPDLSLLGDVTIHELIHSLEVTDGEKTLRGFMVNDVADAEDLPDMLYLTNGDVMPVAVSTNVQATKTSATMCEVTVVPAEAGWNYGCVADPTHGLATITSVVRKSDGTALSAQNFWQTDRTLRDGKDWLYENRLHLADNFADGTAQTYILTFEPVPETLLEIAAIEGIPADGTLATEPVDDITVRFNKAIDPVTFTADDLTLVVQGTKQDISQIAISTDDNTAFTLHLTPSTLHLPNGYYVLTVATADITDHEGFQGRNGRQAAWVMYRGGLVQLLTSTYPANSGTVSRGTQEDTNGSRLLTPANDDETATYGSTVVLTAEPAEGYEFSSWSLNGETVSTDPQYTTTALGDMDVVANFVKKKYMVNIASADETMGTVSGTGTGIYEHGTNIELTAVPAYDYAFKEWIVDGAAITSPSTLSLTVDKELDVKASFLREYYYQTLRFTRGWNWVSGYLQEPIDLATIANGSNRILSQTNELIRDPQLGMVGPLQSLQPAESYKVQAASTFSCTFRGHLVDVAQNGLSLEKGWNWMGYPSSENQPISTIVNPEEGDYIAAQEGFSEYANGSWAGSLAQLTPGQGYLYKSATQKTLAFDFTEAPAGSRMAKSQISNLKSQTSSVDPHQYPSTMNITARIYRDGMELPGSQYTVYAYAGDELRGVSQFVGENHYLTVYGDEPVNISFIVESAETGETFSAAETLTFVSDVVGSRKSPYAVNISTTTGISQQMADTPMTIYTLDGILVSRDATIKTLHTLPKGVYIVRSADGRLPGKNGRKTVVK
ncbi:MAG: Ig-like domain-containing protein [Prevotella sp.]|nr:Ig-like domain-containing protein [Prevotella sp.]